MYISFCEGVILRMIPRVASYDRNADLHFVFSFLSIKRCSTRISITKVSSYYVPRSHLDRVLFCRFFV